MNSQVATSAWLSSLKQQDELLRQQEVELSKLSDTDVAAREAVLAKIADVNSKKEALRSIALQQLVNNRSIRQEDADKERNRQSVSKQKAELKQAQDFEASLAKTAGATRSPEAERTYQQQPKFIRGALQSQLNRWRRAGKTGFPRFKNPKGYDIGHHPMKRGSVNPKHLRFEITNDNRPVGEACA